MTHKLVIVKKRDPERDPRVTFFLLFFRSLRLCSAQRILKSDCVNLTFAALRLTFIRGHQRRSERLPTVHCDCVSSKMAEFSFARCVFTVFLCVIFTGLES